jgi:hypothetical protein
MNGGIILMKKGAMVKALSDYLSNKSTSTQTRNGLL